MATYDVEARIDITETTTKSKLYGRLDEDVAKGESTVYDPYTVPTLSSDLAIPLGSVGTAATLYLESASTDALTFKLNGTGSTAITLTNGFVLFKGATITSLHVGVAGASDIDLVVIAIEA